MNPVLPLSGLSARPSAGAAAIPFSARPIASGAKDTVQFSGGYQPRTVAIEDARIAQSDGTVLKGAVVINGKKIVSVTKELPEALRHNKSALVIKAPPGSLLTPGLIEQHTHGGWLADKNTGVNFNLASVEDMKALLDSYPAQGITRLMPAVMTGTFDEMDRALANLETLIATTREKPGAVQIEGIHLEGPFISTAKRGAHNEQQIQAATLVGLALLKRIFAVAPDLKLITIAPEIDGAETLIKYCVSRGVRVNMGHTAATGEQARQAIDWGVTGVTHTFNAMDGITHKPGKSGIIPVVTNSPQVSPEIIADGHHVNPDTVGMFLNNLHNQNAILVSDGSGLVGAPEGAESELGGQKVFNRGGAAVNEEGNLAGSTAFLTDCVRNVVDWGIKTLPQAVVLASKNPAAFLGFDAESRETEGKARLGQIAPGFNADLVLWDEGRKEVLQTWIDGQSAFQKG